MTNFNREYFSTVPIFLITSALIFSNKINPSFRKNPYFAPCRYPINLNTSLGIVVKIFRVPTPGLAKICVKNSLRPLFLVEKNIRHFVNRKKSSTPFLVEKSSPPFKSKSLRPLFSRKSLRPLF